MVFDNCYHSDYSYYSPHLYCPARAPGTVDEAFGWKVFLSEVTGSIPTTGKNNKQYLSV